MSARRKFLFSFLIASAIFLFSPKVIFAGDLDIVINEFLVEPESEQWVELYNKGSNSVSIGGWFIDDDSGTQKFTIPSGTDILPGEFKSFQSGLFNLNWASPDTVRLIKDSTVVDSKSYNGSSGSGYSIGRLPDGSDNWVTFSQPTRGGTNNTSTPTSFPTPTPTPTPSPTPTPPPTTATYKINEVKDENGNVLSSVRVHVDGVYVHHHAPEALTFCDGCKCDGYVDCGFGEHTIRLEKSGFGNWSETKTINVGGFYEANPIMSPLSLASPSPTPSPSPSPTPKETELAATLSGEVLAEENSPQGIYLLGSPTPSPEVLGEKTSKSRTLAKIFLITGLVFLFGASLSLWYNFGRKLQSKPGDEEKVKIID